MDIVKLPAIVLPITAVALDLCTLILLTRRDLAGRFFVFCAFLYASVLTFAILWVTKRYPGIAYTQYFYTYWTLATVNALLAFGVLYELYREVFGQYEGLRRLSGIGFRWGLVALLLLAVAMAWLSPGNDHPMVAAVVLLERSVRIVQVGLVALLFGLAGYSRIHVATPTFGIALGFGLYATVALATMTVMSQVTYAQGSQVVAMAKPVAYNIAAILWVVSLALPARQPRTVVLPRHELQRWSDALLHFLQR